jgi:hypothetical protein
MWSNCELDLNEAVRTLKRVLKTQRKERRTQVTSREAGYGSRPSPA